MFFPVHQNFLLCNVHCPLTSVKTKWDNISPVDEDQWFKYLLFIFISNFLGNHEYFSQYSTQQIIGDSAELAFFPFSVAYICWQMVLSAGHSDVYSKFL